MSKHKRPIPEFDHPLVETHCHLDYLEAMPVGEIIERARAVGVERLVTIAVEPANFDAVRELAPSARSGSITTTTTRRETSSVPPSRASSPSPRRPTVPW